jgi:hypothetical protein
VLLALVLVACAGSQKPNAKGGDRATALGGDVKGSGGERCDAAKPGREVSEYDTSGDGVNDVRKVFLVVGLGVDSRLVMICRETDVNGDRKKDVIRYYDDDGRSLHEEADRDFDGKMDASLVFQDGEVVRKEIDDDRDGTVDTKIFLQNGKPLRAERDLSGRSKGGQWRPDRWEYYEEGRVVRAGTDLDGDSRVDRWDRDLEFKSKQDKEADALAPPADESDAAPAESTAPPPATPAPSTK